jgi:DNA-binding LacI/PurR family transcriptional regulator
MAATIYDVAKQAGVGIGTVSRVLNNSSSVTETTRQKILVAIKELDYRPNAIAQRLSLRKTLTVAVIAPFFTRPAFVERLRGVEGAIAESDYDLILYNVETTAKRDDCFEDVAGGQRVDGALIISLPPSDEDVARFARAGVPTVLVDAHHPDLSTVTVDDMAGGYLATQHLIGLGHRKIAYVSDPLESPFRFTSSSHRYQGYRRALAEANIPFRPDYHQFDEHGQRQARDATRRLLDLPDPPTAIFAASDTQAIGALEALRGRGLRVPQDIAVVGYDDIEVAEYLGLTTIRQPLFETGTKGVELLLETIDDPSERPMHVEMPIQLIVRHSCGGRRQR